MLYRGRARKVRLPVKPEGAPAGDGETAVWRALRADLLRFVEKRVRDTTLAEDVVHDVLLKAYAHRADLKEPAKLRPWLYQITRNTLADHFRAQRPTEALPPDLMDPGGLEVRNAGMELAQCLRPLLAGLAAADRSALTRAEFEGMTQREIASKDGISLSGAKSRVQRARNRLREAVLQCCRVEIDQRGGVMSYAAQRGCDGCGHTAAGAQEPLPDPRRPACR